MVLRLPNNLSSSLVHSINQSRNHQQQQQQHTLLFSSQKQKFVFSSLSSLFFIPFSLSLSFKGDVDFVAPRPIVPTEKSAPTAAPEFTKVRETLPPSAPAGVVVVASNVVGNVSPDGSVVVSASFGGTAGRVSAFATLSDGCNSLRSDAVSVKAGDNIRFSAINARSLAAAPLLVAVNVAGELYDGPAVTVSAPALGSPFPAFDSQTLLWSSL
jgi:hypothetical protein